MISNSKVMPHGASLTRDLDQFFHWSPRLLAITGIAFWSLISVLLALGFGDSPTRLVYQLVLIIVVSGALIVSWNNDLYGAMIFNILAVFATFFISLNYLIIGLLVCLPLLFTGELFFFNWFRSS